MSFTPVSNGTHVSAVVAIVHIEVDFVILCKLYLALYINRSSTLLSSNLEPEVFWNVYDSLLQLLSRKRSVDAWETASTLFPGPPLYQPRSQGLFPLPLYPSVV